jgi:Zn-dependent protease with chaperone function
MSQDRPNHLFQIARYVLLPATLIFVLPIAAWLFTQHTLAGWDAEVEAAQLAALATAPDLNDAERAAAEAFVRAHPFSLICTGDGVTEHGLSIRESIGEECARPKQFVTARSAAQLALLLALLGTAVMAVSTTLAFRSRRLQLLALRFGWNALTLLIAIQVLLQGALFVWLSFWVTAVWFGFYALKLIGLVGLIVLAAMFHVIRAIFLRPKPLLEAEGEFLREEDAPAFWKHLKSLADRVGTQPPDHVIVGIDDNFYVVETPVRVGETQVEGRVLYVSLRFIRQFERDELDVVLAHELAHLLGGDSGHSKQLAPHLAHFEAYLSELASNPACRPVGAFMNAFAVLFQLALQRQRRAAEFAADAVAAQVVSGEALMRSLVRLAAHAHFRGRVQQEMFDASTRLSGSIRQRLAEGFSRYAMSPELNEDLESVLAAVSPHPFDSHPPLAERAAAVGAPVDLERVPARLGPPRQTWLEAIPSAEAIEERLWTAFESHFADAHEEDLALRFAPDTEEERAIVEKYFPPREFPKKEGARPILLDHVQLVVEAPEEVILPLATIRTYALVDDWIGKKLWIHATPHGAAKERKFEVKLRPLADQDDFLGTLDRYLARQRVSEAYRASVAQAAEGAA